MRNMLARGVCLTLTLPLMLGASLLAAPVAGGSPRAAATNAALGAPEDIAFDVAGNVYISEFDGNRVDRVDRAGSLTVIAGTGVPGDASDGGPATLAELNAPTGLLFDPSGHLVIADHHSACMRRIDGAGVIDSIAGWCGRRGYNGDGKFAPLKTKFNDPIGIVEDPLGTMFVADEQNARVRKITPDGVVSTILGGGKTPLPDAPDGTLGTAVQMSHPSYLALDGAGNLYVSDFLWNEVVRVGPDGRITHVAGTGAADFSGDGGTATTAALDFPTGLALDGNGRLYISDSFNQRIRVVSRRGIITTIAGSGAAGYGGDGGPATKAQLNAPSGIAMAPDGSLYIADQGNNIVRVLHPDGTITLFAGVPPTA